MADEGAAKGKVIVTVTPTVRYPDTAEVKAAELERLREDGHERLRLSMVKLNGIIGVVKEELSEGTDWEVTYVENVGLEIVTGNGERYNIQVSEGF